MNILNDVIFALKNAQYLCESCGAFDITASLYHPCSSCWREQRRMEAIAAELRDVPTRVFKRKALAKVA